MAVLEIQFRQQTFFDIIAAQVVRVNPPAELLQQVPPGMLIEKIETGAVTFAGNEILFGDGEIGLKVPLTIHLTNYQLARAAGSLQVPGTIPIPAAVWLRLQGALPYTDSARIQHPLGLRWFIQRVEVNSAFVPIIPSSRELKFDPGVEVADVTLAAGSGAIAIRFATPSGGGGYAPVSNRLGNDDWGQFIDGQIIADELAKNLSDAAHDAAAGSSDPTIDVDSNPTPHWATNPPAAHSSVDLTAVDALPLDIDVPIVIYATTTPSINSVLHQLEVTTRVSWASHDVITTVSSGAITVVEDKVSKAILGKLKPRPGQTEIGRGDRYVVYRGIRPFIEPVTELFRATVEHFSLTGDGVAATGKLHVYPPPAAFFTIEDQHWESGINCTQRRWLTEFKPPVVHILGPDRFYSLQFVQSPTVDPAGFWAPSISWSGLLFAGNQIAHVTFGIPDFGLRPAGQTSSGFIVTNLGVRWVDLGAIPPHPPAPADPIGIQAFVISQCMAISDPWGLGVMNLEWLVDPPDLDLGLSKVREWTIAGTDLPAGGQIELIASGPHGERPLSTLSVRRGAAFAQVITDSNETLQLRSTASLSTAPPQVMQRWIVPWASAPVGKHVQGLMLSKGQLFAVSGQHAELLDMQAPGFRARSHESAAIPEIVRTSLARREENSHIGPRTAGRGRAVAVLHRGTALMGFAGPLVPVTEGLVRGDQPVE